MTDDDRPDEVADDRTSRTSRAFRDAFDRHAGDLPAGPDLTDVRRRARRRSTLTILGAAATVVALLTVTFTVTGERSEIEGRTPVADATTAGPSVSTPSAPSPTSPPSTPREGWRLVSYRDVELKVPQSWGDDIEPSSDWCIDESSLPSEPYVAREQPNRVVATIGCLGEGDSSEVGLSSEPPTGLWAPHVTLGAGHGDARVGVTAVDGWTVVRERVGAAFVSVTVRDPQLAEDILATAVVVDEDFNGCLARDPIQSTTFERPTPPYDLTAIGRVDSVSVCMYPIGDFADPSQPRLISSTRLVGQAAADELAALRAAPVGGGPEQPQNCAAEMVGDEAIVLWLNSGEERYRVHVYYSWCFHNGFDDGTTMRALTLESCSPLFQPPVRSASVSAGGRGFSRICGPR